MQSRIDSVMEVVSNTAVGFVLSMITWRFVALAFGIPMPMGENIEITAIFTVVSLLRSYTIRRVFNGRTIWQALKDRFGGQTVSFVDREIAAASEAERHVIAVAEQARKHVEQEIALARETEEQALKLAQHARDRVASLLSTRL